LFVKYSYFNYLLLFAPFFRLINHIISNKHEKIIDATGSTLYDKEYKMNELKNFGRDMYELGKKYNPDFDDEDDTQEDCLNYKKLQDKISNFSSTSTKFQQIICKVSDYNRFTLPFPKILVLF